MKKILFITTANLSTNPRLYKEITLAEKFGYDVSFIAFWQGGWSDEKDRELVKTIRGRAFYLSALRTPYFSWLWGSIVQKFFQWVWPVFKDHLYVSAVAHNKRTYRILKFLKKNREHYDLLIGHNLGALYPVSIYSKVYSIPFAFDIEDYHPGEASAANDKDEIARRKQLLSVLLPHAAYYSYASPMIGQHVAEFMHPSLFARRLLVNNCFSKDEFTSPRTANGKLKLVWFSQNISWGRGLEWVLPMLDKFKQDIQVTLIGALNDKFNEEHLTRRSYVEVLEPVSQKTLNILLSDYDIGLALELNTTDFNRQICLTNKIWSYLQAGLFILATDTPAQRLFISERPSAGLVVEQNIDAFQKGITEILKRKEEIRKEALYRFSLSHEFSWEAESKKLKKVWGDVLTSN